MVRPDRQSLGRNLKGRKSDLNQRMPQTRTCFWPGSKANGLLFCIKTDTNFTMKPILFLSDCLARLRDFPEQARSLAGYQLRQVQKGLDPTDWKPMKTVGPGVREIRIREASGAFRVIYLAAIDDAVVVLHAFQKKTQQTPQKEIDLTALRLRAWRE